MRVLICALLLLGFQGCATMSDSDRAWFRGMAGAYMSSGMAYSSSRTPSYVAPVKPVSCLTNEIGSGTGVYSTTCY